MKKIRIENLPVNIKIDKEEMRRAIGGSYFNYFLAPPLSQKSYWPTFSSGMLAPPSPSGGTTPTILSTTLESPSPSVTDAKFVKD